MSPHDFCSKLKRYWTFFTLIFKMVFWKIFFFISIHKYEKENTAMNSLCYGFIMYWPPVSICPYMMTGHFEKHYRCFSYRQLRNSSRIPMVGRKSSWVFDLTGAAGFFFSLFPSISMLRYFSLSGRSHWTTFIFWDKMYHKVSTK